MDIGWTFERLYKKDVNGNFRDIMFDGRDVWVATTSALTVLNWWDEDTNGEYLDAAYYFDRHTVDFHVIAEIGLSAELTANALSPSLYVTKMVQLNDSVHCLMSDSLTITTWSKTSKKITAHTTAPESVNSLAVANGKLWMTSVMPEDASDQQRLHSYAVATDAWAVTVIPGRKQIDVPRDMVDGLDGYLYVTAANDHAIHKFNASNGNFVSTHRINRAPYALAVTQDKKVWIASDKQGKANAGMLTSFDQSTNTPTNKSAVGGSIKMMTIDERTNKAWFFGEACSLGRLDLTTGDFRFRPTPGNTAVTDAWYPPSSGFTITLNDWELDCGPMGVGTDPGPIKGGLVTPQINYQRWNGSALEDVTVLPYVMFASQKSGVVSVFAARASAMVRVNKIDVLGTAMVATGAQNYYGG